MEEKSAYLLSEVDVAGQEVRRLSAQAQLFLDLELPLLLAQAPAQGVLADFGCGSGDIAQAVADARPQAQVWGLDADPLAVEQSQRRQGGQANLRFAPFVLGSRQAAPVPPLDLAFTRLVLLHVGDPVAALQDMAAALGPSGKVYVVETDDSLMEFLPAEPWQRRLLAVLEQVQRSRGGSRQRGSAIGDCIADAGLKPQLQSTVWYRKSAIGAEAFAELFLPVTHFYLQQAAQSGLASPEECDSLAADAKAFVGDARTEIAMALLHWVGTR